jgi:carbonic anhydrase/acetyltransferase-like protein (isoleucine patch superfamily)
MAPILQSFEGHTPRLGEGCYLAETAVLVGDVVLEKDASVWYNAVVRADGEPIRIGARTNIQDLSMVHVTRGGHGTTIGEDVTVGHRAIVHACKVGDRCLVGMGAIILDGAEIGDDSIVGAGAVVPAGMKVPPHSLVVGIPAKVKKTLNETDREMIRELGEAYLINKEIYR